MSDTPSDKTFVTIQKCILEEENTTILCTVISRKMEVIQEDMAWQYLTKELCIEKDKLIITIFNEDDESEKLWTKISGFDSGRIIRISSKDNFGLWRNRTVWPV